MATSRVQCSFLRRTNLKLQILMTIATILVMSQGTHGFFLEWGPDLEGPWCATRPPGQDCCDGRDDMCSVPILGTECYCDIFCNDTAYDCCPDYWPHCHGFSIRPTPRTTTLPPRTTRFPIEPCMKDGRAYAQGETITDNCNECTCEVIERPYRRTEWKCTEDPCLIRPELIDAVNDGPYTWRARNYSKFWGQTLDDGIRYRLGTFLLPDNVVRMTAIRVEDDVLPESFDSREKWPNMLHPISDQGNCASSWAHSTIGVATDRLAIESDGLIKDDLSVQHLLACHADEEHGCSGGHVDQAWWFLRKKGVVSEDCYPYTSGETAKKGDCMIKGKRGNQPCPSGIDQKTSTRYEATPPYRIRPMEREIMKEIMDNGPVQATLQVREDFFMYSRGIYKYTELTTKRGDPEEYIKSGFHSVRILGWGAERNAQGDIIKYWIGANSWGPGWGENGYFRILRGTDESRIERYVIGVWGKVSGDNELRELLIRKNRERRLRASRAQRRRRHLRHINKRMERRNRRRRLRWQYVRDSAYSDKKKHRPRKNKNNRKHGRQNKQKNHAQHKKNTHSYTKSNDDFLYDLSGYVRS